MISRKQKVEVTVTDEEILGIFRGWMKDESSRILQRGWTLKLVFTTNRLIIAGMNKHMGMPPSSSHPEYIVSRANTLERMRTKESASAEGILKEDAANFEIPYSVITVVDVKEHGKGFPFDLRIFIDDLNVPKYRFKIDLRYPYFAEFIEFLRTVLPGKV